MKNCGSLLESIITNKKVVRKDLCTFIGTSPQNLSKILRKDSIDAGTLEKFCQFLNIDPADFFDFRPLRESRQEIGDVTQNNMLSSGNINISAGEASMMERLLEEKDARIKALEKTIAAHEKTISLFELAANANNIDTANNSTDK